MMVAERTGFEPAEERRSGEGSVYGGLRVMGYGKRDIGYNIFIIDLGKSWGNGSCGRVIGGMVGGMMAGMFFVCLIPGNYLVFCWCKINYYI